MAIGRLENAKLEFSTVVKKVDPFIVHMLLLITV
jgi:hypothetical protein